ncbi:TolC family protein [bacterium]|nr:TolC family protein [bacterium]
MVFRKRTLHPSWNGSGKHQLLSGGSYHQPAHRPQPNRVIKVIPAIDLISCRAQLAAAQRESYSLAHSLAIAREQFETGLTSQIELLEIERHWLETKRSETSLQHTLLSARLDLIKATGGERW